MKHLLSSSAFLIVNKNLVKQIGLKPTIILADLISKEQYFETNHLLVDGWFFNTEKNIQDDTTLSPHQQRKALQHLKELQIIETKRKGIPAKMHYKINTEVLVKFLNNKDYNNLITNNNNKEIKINNKYFKRPTILQVKNYCIERENNVDAEAFCDFYDSKNWMVGKNKMKDWKASVRTWERRNKTHISSNTLNKNKIQTLSKIDIQLNEYEKGKQYL
tara:strand:+ start:441 stop:1094 length:654 start_codon:yes stop_codon:yes gene_type:complete